MKKNVKNKKILICIITTLILIGLIVGGIFIFGNNKENKDTNKETTNNYIAYVKINPLIKIEYSQTCKNKNCSDPTVTKYELTNDDAKNIYNNIDLIGTNNKLYDVLTLISKTAEDNNIKFETVEIYSDWNNLNNYIDNNAKENNNWSYNVNIRDKENLEEISNSLIENKILYTVSFNTDGGTEINFQTVEKDSLVKEPTAPSKKGYNFIEWQLDNNKFDFNTKITSNITLIAIWKKEETPTNNNSNKNEIDKKPSSDDSDKNQNSDSNGNQNSDSNGNQNNNSNEIFEKTIETSLIETLNIKTGYRAKIAGNYIIKVSIKGKKDIVEKLNAENLNLYVDLNGLIDGNHEVEIKTKNTSNGLTYNFSPSKISIIIDKLIQETEYFDIPWEIINDGTYEQFAKEHGITINLVADSKYQCNSHFSPPADSRGYKKGDIVTAYGIMMNVCIEDCDCFTYEECMNQSPKYEERFGFGSCGG